MTEYSNFADTPISISEARAKKTDNAKDWTPRDVLINALRDIDNGNTNPTSLIICVYEKNDNETIFSHYNCSQSRLEAVGLLEQIKFKFMEY